METKTSVYNIGDIVLSHGHICEVYAIGKEYDLRMGERSYWLKEVDGKKDDLGENDCNQVLPVPLGETNIKSLGFKERELHQGFFLEKKKLLLKRDRALETYSLYVYHKCGEVYKHMADRDVIDGVKIAEIRYFHELQHILASLGLKNIINFDFNK